MATDAPGLGRRQWLAGMLVSGIACPALAAPRGRALAATWQSPPQAGGWRAGLLRRDGGVLRVEAEVELPTRAHGLAPLAGDRLLVAARRPGDWLLCWEPATGRARWTWAEPDRCFTGHLRIDPATARVYTGETDLATGAGLIGVRDARSLEKVGEWPTHGRDPHQFVPDGAGGLLVANGGIETRPESGRRKLSLESMDSSLVRLDAASGSLRGQWRLDDRRLSLRHLAWTRADRGAVLGIAMQAEHDDAAVRVAAPVLAVFDGRALRTAQGSSGLAGYAGDIAPHADGWALSATRAGAVAFFDAAGRRRGRAGVPDACPLVDAGGELLAGGAGGGVLAGPAGVRSRWRVAGRLDNHWTLAG